MFGNIIPVLSGFQEILMYPRNRSHLTTPLGQDRALVAWDLEGFAPGSWFSRGSARTNTTTVMGSTQASRQTLNPKRHSVSILAFSVQAAKRTLPPRTPRPVRSRSSEMSLAGLGCVRVPGKGLRGWGLELRMA